MGTNEGNFARLDEKVISLARSHSELRERVDELEQTVTLHTTVLDQHQISHQKIDELHTIFTQVKGGFVVLGWLGKTAKFLWPVVLLVTAIIAWIKTGVWAYGS